MGFRAAPRIASVLIAGALAAGGTAATAATGTTVQGAGFVSYGPTRFLDTRSGLGTGTPGAVAPFGTVRLAVSGVAGLPADVSAVVMNVTVTNPTVGGFITVYPDGGSRPLASNLNFTAGQTVPNLTMIPVGANGFVDLYNGSPGSSDLIADITGYYTRGGGAGYVPAGVFRVFDTRTGEGTDSGVAGPVPAGAVLTQTIVGHIPVPRGATTIVLTAMATQPQGPGFVTVYPSGVSRPVASNLNFVAGQTIANTVVVPLGADGKINFYAHATTQLVVDVLGYFVPGNRNLFVPVTPVRKVDTREGAGPIPAHADRTFQLYDGVLEPQLESVAVVYNATVVTPRNSGFLSMWENSDFPSAFVGSVPFTAGSIMPNLLVTELSSSGSMLFRNGSAGSLDLVVDVSGYFAAF